MDQEIQSPAREEEAMNKVSLPAGGGKVTVWYEKPETTTRCVCVRCRKKKSVSKLKAIRVDKDGVSYTDPKSPIFKEGCKALLESRICDDCIMKLIP